jgi:hypothetical protein
MEDDWEKSSLQASDKCEADSRCYRYLIALNGMQIGDDNDIRCCGIERDVEE